VPVCLRDLSHFIIMFIFTFEIIIKNVVNLKEILNK